MLSEIHDSAAECSKLATDLGPNREKSGKQNFNNALKDAKVLPMPPCPDPGPSSPGTSSTPDYKNSPLPITT